MKKDRSSNRLDEVVAESQRNRAKREQGYREKALRMYPWICGRCRREFTRATVHELTVHHRDHNHDNNPSDGSNWELLCLYCHDNEHARFLDGESTMDSASTGGGSPPAAYKPFAELGELLKRKE
ncbi:HNH endonuclease [Nitrosococcus halophilus Nc 4]|uniref:Putative HNH nuclease YajD n=1 Tax=Nitrosococcus halophilus (strain Nc4) TaxID=472759 RepID=D5BWE0_NITHN|nr:YajD family HNH nuclease [Nitrosococcus halophilus]ADE15597.1 HNH endonuclease [Nitrosococcus halophilus Nc 4]